MMQLPTNQIAKRGVLLALGLVLSYVESLIPFYFGIPGAKLGLTNLMVILALYAYGWKEALSLNLMRILLAGFLFGNFFGILYSLAGAGCSFVAMIIGRKVLKEPLFSMAGISVLGGIFHNIGQILVATVLISHFSFIYYLPFLLVTGAIAGYLIGRLGELIIRRGVL